jgi:protein-S-isoprenylcysteine O-methyltransferase Ste14
VTFVSLVGLLLMIGGLASLIFDHLILSPAIVVILLQACAVALMVWARITFGFRSFHATAAPTRGAIVTSGPYRFIRHPIYTAVCLFSWACVVGYPGWHALRLAGATTFGGVLRMVAEETLLQRQYPEYAEYARRTKRMLPYVF